MHSCVHVVMYPTTVPVTYAIRAVMLRACTEALTPQFNWTAIGVASGERWLQSPNYRSLVSVRVGSSTSYTFQVTMMDGKGRSNQASVRVETNQPPHGGLHTLNVTNNSHFGTGGVLYAMDTVFDVLLSVPWSDEHLPLSYRYRAAENKLLQVNMISLTDGYVATQELRARTLPYFGTEGTMVVVSVRDALDAASTCAKPGAKAAREQPCPRVSLHRLQAKTLGGITSAIDGLQARVHAGFLSRHAALAELHAEVARLNALYIANEADRDTPRRNITTAKNRGVTRAESGGCAPKRSRFSKT